MKIGIVGGGPAGLYFALLMKQQHPAYQISLIEQNPADATYGWGVVFSDRALSFLKDSHPASYAAIEAELKTWDDQTIVHQGQAVKIDGSGYAGIARLTLLRILQEHCRQQGVELHFMSRLADVGGFADCDVIVGADGVNSMVRQQHAGQFLPSTSLLFNRYIWYGTHQLFDTLSLIFRRHQGGAFVAHCYPFSQDTSTFIVECDAGTWERAGFAAMSEQESIAYCERVFAEDLNGHRLLPNKPAWLQFRVVTNQRWSYDKVILLGDALRTVHFSIGSGTRMALEDAITLAHVFATTQDVPAAFQLFEEQRRPPMEKLLAIARQSYSWYETFHQKMELDPLALSYGYMTRSGRLDAQTLRQNAPRFMTRYEQHFPQKEGKPMIEQDVTAHEQEVTQLYEDMRAYSLIPLWRIEEATLLAQPRPATLAWLWKWGDLYPIAQRAGRLVPVERGGDRRAIALSNPGLQGRPFATPTLWAAIQWLNGHEVAPAHRHTAQAVRFIINGSGSWSTVEGDRVFLERGDFVLTPAWLWHDHGSKADEPAVWMDALDIPLNNYLDASFFEPYPEEAQAVTKAPSTTVLKYGVGQLRPAWEPRSLEYPPMHTYKWAATEQALTNLAQVAASPFDDVALEYTNPHTGGSVMPSFACWIQMLRPGIQTQAHRHVGSVVYHVHEGRGETIVNGVRFAWEQGDMFVVPSWAWHEHHNATANQRAILFSVRDTPTLVALNKYREEAYQQHNGHQPITGDFAPRLEKQ